VARGDFKADPREIIRAHRRTYADARTGRPLRRDRLVFEYFPLAVLGCCLGFRVVLSVAASVGLLTVSGLLGALLFGVVIQLSATAIGLADDAPEPGPATSAYATFIEELSRTPATLRCSALPPRLSSSSQASAPAGYCALVRRPGSRSTPISRSC
jgi:hypothetical protein